MSDHWPCVIIAIFVEKSRYLGDNILTKCTIIDFRHGVVAEQGCQNQKVQQYVDPDSTS